VISRHALGDITHRNFSMSRFEFSIATAADEPGLQELSRTASMQGAIRIGFDRSPDYFASLRPEGRQTDVLVCRESQSRRIVAIGHRSVRQLWVNGAVTQVGYLGGLRITPDAQRGMVFARGYKFLRERHADHQVKFYLSTIMEDNRPALSLLKSGRCSLPRYQDLGRFCCMAVSTGSGKRHTRHQLQIRPATPADVTAIIAFLHHEGSKRQFYPVYRPEDFDRNDGLLPGLSCENIMLAWQGSELVGVTAGWDQREFRRWYIASYTPWLRALRIPINAVTACKGLPRLPPSGAKPQYFILSLICIRNDDAAIFEVLLDKIILMHRSRYAFCLAGLHERDPLVSVLRAQPHVPMPSKLFAVSWDDGAEAVSELQPGLVPYLELGSL
jgi:hypothetical protein